MSRPTGSPCIPISPTYMLERCLHLGLSDGDVHAAKQVWTVGGFFSLLLGSQRPSAAFLKLNSILLSIPITDGGREQRPEMDGRESGTR